MEGVGLVTGFQFFTRLSAVFAEEVGNFNSTLLATKRTALSGNIERSVVGITTTINLSVHISSSEY